MYKVPSMTSCCLVTDYLKASHISMAQLQTVVDDLLRLLDTAYSPGIQVKMMVMMNMPNTSYFPGIQLM